MTTETQEREDRATAQLDIKAVMEALKTRDAEIKTWCEKATNEIKDTGKASEETKLALTKLSELAIGLQARLLDAEQKLARRPGSETQIAKSVGQMFTESDEFKALQKNRRGTARMEFKAVTSITSTTSGTGAAGGLLTPDYQMGVLTPFVREMTVRDLIMPGRTSEASVQYFKETGFQNMAAAVAEGAAKPQSDIKFAAATANVATIAHWFKASNQVLADVPMLESYIDGRARYGLKYVEEAQLLTGDGTGANLLGIIPQSTAYNTGLTVVGDTKIDTLRRAILQCRIAEFRPTGIVLNPIEWAGIELQKDSTGQYVWVNPQNGGTQTMWRLPVVDTNSLPAGKFLVGAFKMGAQVFDREDANVQVSTEDGDNFIKNMCTIRAEERLALAVYRPESFIYGTFP